MPAVDDCSKVAIAAKACSIAGELGREELPVSVIAERDEEYFLKESTSTATIPVTQNSSFVKKLFNVTQILSPRTDALKYMESDTKDEVYSLGSSFSASSEDRRDSWLETPCSKLMRGDKAIRIGSQLFMVVNVLLDLAQ